MGKAALDFLIYASHSSKENESYVQFTSSVYGLTDLNFMVSSPTHSVCFLSMRFN
jgi:hypothetical protein